MRRMVRRDDAGNPHARLLSSDFANGRALKKNGGPGIGLT